MAGILPRRPTGSGELIDRRLFPALGFRLDYALPLLDDGANCLRRGAGGGKASAGNCRFRGCAVMEHAGGGGLAPRRAKPPAVGFGRGIGRSQMAGDLSFTGDAMLDRDHRPFRSGLCIQANDQVAPRLSYADATKSHQRQ